MKYITPQEFLELPLSQAIRQAVEDVQQLVSTGVKVHMGDWVRTKHGRVCSVCLGGAVLMSFPVEADHDDPSNNLLHIYQQLGWTCLQGNRVTSTFNTLRQGNIADAFACWYAKDAPYDVRGLSSVYFYDRVRALETMYTCLQDIADALEKLGY